MDEFPIMRVDRSRSQSMEPLGSKPKFWFREGERHLLFKAENRGTGEDWAEVVSCHLCEILCLPHVKYELAAEYDGNTLIGPGVVCENMARKPLVLVLGNQLLLQTDSEYPQSQRFRVCQHTVEAVSDIVKELDLPPVEWMQNVPVGIKSALDVFVGYIMLDAWIANQDRHHENWGALSDHDNLRLSPTFDHGAALGRNLLDSERTERLNTKDKNRKVEAFAARGRSAFYGSRNDSRPLKLWDAFQKFAQYSPKAANVWCDRLRMVSKNQISDILKRIPSWRMSDICKQFTFELILTNQRRLLE